MSMLEVECCIDLTGPLADVTLDSATASAISALPKGIAAKNGTVITVSVKNEAKISNGGQENTIKLAYSPLSVAISPAGDEAAIGGEVRLGFYPYLEFCPFTD